MVYFNNVGWATKNGTRPAKIQPKQFQWWFPLDDIGGQLGQLNKAESTIVVASFFAVVISDSKSTL